MLVADASVAVKALTEEPGSEAAAILLASEDGVIAPELIKLEVASALSKKVRYDRLPVEMAEASLEALSLFVSEFVSTEALIGDGMRLSIRLRHALQHCIYLALALEWGLPLATNDMKFVAAVRASDIDVRLIIPGAPK